MFQVIFTHDDTAKKWVATIKGATSKTEARQGFTAVVVTCQMLDANLQQYASLKLNGDTYEITPAV